MIDQERINRSIEAAKSSLLTCESTISPNLHIVNDLLDDKLLSELKDYLDQNSDKWDLKIHLRAGVSWEADTVIEEVHTVFDNLTTVISQHFFDTPLNFIGTQVWKDRSPFFQNWHIDNPIINVAIQLYLFDAPAECGTTFIIDIHPVAVPYIHNCGYILTTYMPPGITHRPSIATPPGVVRYSIYAIWSLTEKMIEKETTC